MDEGEKGCIVIPLLFEQLLDKAIRACIWDIMGKFKLLQQRRSPRHRDVGKWYACCMLSVQSCKCGEGWLQSLPRQLHVLEILLQLSRAEHGLVALINLKGQSGTIDYSKPSWQGILQMLKQV